MKDEKLIEQQTKRHGKSNIHHGWHRWFHHNSCREIPWCRWCRLMHIQVCICNLQNTVKPDWATISTSSPPTNQTCFPHWLRGHSATSLCFGLLNSVEYKFDCMQLLHNSDMQISTIWETYILLDKIKLAISSNYNK